MQPVESLDGRVGWSGKTSSNQPFRWDERLLRVALPSTTDGPAVNAEVRLSCTPSQHVSGRSAFDRWCALWAAWVVEDLHLNKKSLPYLYYTLHLVYKYASSTTPGRSPSSMNHSPSSFRPHVISRAPSNDIVIRATSREQFVLLLVPAMLEGFFFGLYTALFAFSTFFTLRKGLSNRTRYAMLAVSVVMYAASAIHWTLTFAHAIRSLRIGQFTTTLPEMIAVACLPSINIILSDGIVLWRAWLLWDRRVVLFILPFLFLVCTVVFTIVDLVYQSDILITHSMRHANTGQDFAWAILGLSVGTNLWATSLMFIRAWQHRRFLRSLFDTENAKSKAEKTLAFLVESGAIYLCIWVAYITILASGSVWVAALDRNLIQFAGIYPTTVVVVITMRLSAADILSRPGRESRSYSTPIVFMPRSPTLQISEAGSNDSDTENGRKTTMRLVQAGPVT
ncbi:hypothetical protein BGW80DRAFT_1460868 [Lactifluus volemus]|nr:hypothetical protein BGW80DRAFT_1460868 [Lactifluus volemus]